MGQQQNALVSWDELIDRLKMHYNDAMLMLRLPSDLGRLAWQQVYEMSPDPIALNMAINDWSNHDRGGVSLKPLLNSSRMCGHSVSSSQCNNNNNHSSTHLGRLARDALVNPSLLYSSLNISLICQLHFSHFSLI